MLPLGSTHFALSVDYQCVAGYGLVLIFGKDDSVEVTAYEVTEDYADIDAEYLEKMGLDECNRNAEEVEHICDAVREAAYDEERHTEQKRKVLSLSCKMYGCGHYETASYRKKTAFQGTRTKTKLHDLLGSSLNIHRRHPGKKSDTKTSDDVAEKNPEKIPYLILIDETRSTGIKFQLISDNCQQSEGEKHGTDKRSIRSLKAGSQISEACSTDAHTGED